jgi:hypothetical protein
MINNQSQPKFEIWWDKKEKIIRIHIFGEQTEKEAKNIIEETEKLIASLEKKGVKAIKILADMTKAGAASSEARSIFSEFFKGGTLDKIALFGGEKVPRIMAKMMFAYASYKKAKYFDIEKEALKWLKEK